MQAPDSSRPFGFATTDVELAELENRTGGEAAERAVKYGEQYSDEFGGLWVDQSRGGLVAVAFTDGLETHKRALRNRVGSDRVTVVDVEWSLGALNAARATIEQDMVADDVLPWTGVAVDVRANRVMLSFSSVDEEASDIIEERYGGLPVCLDAFGEFRTVE
jgi:hypothetical protein